MLIHLWVPGIDPSAGGIQAYSAQTRDALIRLGHECRVIAHDGKRLTFIRRALLAALFEKPDLIFSTHLNFSPLARIAKRFRRIPYAVTLHGIEAWKVSRQSVRTALQTADVLLPVSEFTRGQVTKNLGESLPKMELLPNTFDPEAFQIAVKSATVLSCHCISPEAPVILTIGRLDGAEAYKGHDAIIRALPAVIVQKPTVIYLIVGGGDDRTRLETLATSLGLSEQVRFAGHVPGAELAGYYQTADVFAMPSRGEGFGIVYLEAMACGKPVIASNLDAGRDALDGGRLGVVVNPESPGKLAKALLACLDQTHPNRLIFNPPTLRAEVLRAFGPEPFQQRLAAILQPFDPCAE